MGKVGVCWLSTLTVALDPAMVETCGIGLGEGEEVIKHNPYGHRAGMPLLTHQPMDILYKVLPEMLLEPLHSYGLDTFIQPMHSALEQHYCGTL
jgi:hypothetical protein